VAEYFFQEKTGELLAGHKKGGVFLFRRSLFNFSVEKKRETPMDFTKIASRLRAKVARFSGELSKRLGKTATRFVTEAVYGIMASQSVLLTEIGRTLDEDVSLKKIEERFCRQLGKPGLWYQIHRSLLEQASNKIKDDTLLVLDISDIRKKYAEKMEYVAPVRDGSEKVIGRGYWTCNVIGTDLESNQVIPLYHSLYSQDSPEFSSENAEILKAVTVIGKQIGKRGVWVMDRGADRGHLYRQLLKEEYRFIIRLVGTRDLMYCHRKVNALSLALSCPCPYSETVVRIKEGREKPFHLHYGYVPVRLPEHPDSPLWMLVVKGFGRKPLMILTTEPLRRSQKVLRRILSAYIRRWSVEETIRFVKQTYDLENIRVLRYVCLKNMMVLVLMVFYFLAVVLDTNQKLKLLAGHVLDSAKRVFGIPDFKYYALGDGICAIFRRNPGKIVPKPKKPPGAWQITLKFT
jgi:hypothetical protein